MNPTMFIQLTLFCLLVPMVVLTVIFGRKGLNKPYNITLGLLVLAILHLTRFDQGLVGTILVIATILLFGGRALKKDRMRKLGKRAAVVIMAFTIIAGAGMFCGWVAVQNFVYIFAK